MADRSVFSTIEEALEDVRAGGMVIVVDDADRENEGDFVMAAEKVTPEAVNFMATHGRGIVCMPVAAFRLDELRIPLMVSRNPDGHRETAFAISIDARRGTTTGTSAHDRAATVWPSAIRGPGRRTSRCPATSSPSGPRRAGC